MSRLILILALVLVGCKVEVRSQSQSNTLRECNIEIEVMHVGGGENTVEYSFQSTEDCHQTAQRAIKLSGSGNLTIGPFAGKILATSVASYRIKTKLDTF